MADIQNSRLPSILTGLRALIMLIGGLYALIFPEPALLALVVVAGVLFLADGVLGLWAITFGGVKTGNFWFDVIRNVLSILAGILIIISPLLATLLTATVLIYIVAIQAIAVGVMEIVVVVRERELYAKIWPVVLSGVTYVLFGILLALWPLYSAIVMVMVGGALMIVFSVALFALALRLWRKGH